MERINTFITVTIVTLLIWVFAESESVKSKTIYVDLIAASGPAAARVIRLQDGRPLTVGVDVTVLGPTSRISALEQTLPKSLEIEPGMEGVPATPGPHALDLREILRRHPALDGSGVNFEDVKPSTVSVVVDEIATREFKVRVDAPEGTLDGPAEPSPATVRVRLPESLAADLPPAPEVIARVSAEALATLTEGRRATISNIVPILPEALRGSTFVRVEPAQVDVALTVRSKTATCIIPSVPVQLRIPPVEYGAWDITVAEDDRVLRNVTVTGPADLVGRIERGEQKIIATVALAFDELERARTGPAEITKDATFSDLPAPVKFEVEDKSVKVRIAPRRIPEGPDLEPLPHSGRKPGG